ncbi:ABC-ATPase domain-containing protein [Natranaerofaba carboxydovora]|uniref:ABC-ATPase domain-containing protein n=1 Tax=Natranaerofaba carboxydovora TaxID=2742683 RepID=UPI001F129325|nr:ABC-ATPase domain-containing protein [Natranaerofaba carboxydovora]UMZ73239.1 putative ATPase of the ABC class [Natranaerofaba carboxydovora]
MADLEYLLKTLNRIDGKGYKAYKDIQGQYDYLEGTLYIDYVQGDPFASPSKLRFRVPMSIANFPEKLFANKSRKVALEDYLTRAFSKACNKSKGGKGTGKSGMIAIDSGKQEVLERTSMVVTNEYVEARFVVGLPAKGRKILGKVCAEMFEKEITDIVKESLLYESFEPQKLEEHVAVVEDQDYLRDYLKNSGYIAFVGNGAILPRRSGVDDRPLTKGAVKFQSPSNLEVEIELPNRGKVKGMGVKEGVTLIVGGGYHGKSTLLKAIERGIYNHLPGDGRELVVSLEESVKIRAEDGRKVEKVNISPFINNLPHGADTKSFSSEDASGSTSQAANIMEALEMGAKALLLDEDTSATNFMIRDVRMQNLVAKDKEPITPFIDKIRSMYADLGVSTVLVVGGSGDYFDVSDSVIMMDNYEAYEVTKEAKDIAKDYETKRSLEGGDNFGEVLFRTPAAGGLDPRKGKKKKIKQRGLHQIQYGIEEILLQDVEQLVDESQTRAIGEAIYYLYKNYLKNGWSLKESIDKIMEDIDNKGLDIISEFKGGEHPGEYARFRPFEIASALNRLRSFSVKTLK